MVTEVMYHLHCCLYIMYIMLLVHHHHHTHTHIHTHVENRETRTEQRKAVGEPPQEMQSSPRRLLVEKKIDTQKEASHTHPHPHPYPHPHPHPHTALQPGGA